MNEDAMIDFTAGKEEGGSPAFTFVPECRRTRAAGGATARRAPPQTSSWEEPYVEVGFGLSSTRLTGFEPEAGPQVLAWPLQGRTNVKVPDPAWVGHLDSLVTVDCT